MMKSKKIKKIEAKKILSDKSESWYIEEAIAYKICSFPIPVFLYNSQQPTLDCKISINNNHRTFIPTKSNNIKLVGLKSGVSLQTRDKTSNETITLKLLDREKVLVITGNRSFTLDSMEALHSVLTNAEYPLQIITDINKDTESLLSIEQKTESKLPIKINSPLSYLSYIEYPTSSINMDASFCSSASELLSNFDGIRGITKIKSIEDKRKHIVDRFNKLANKQFLPLIEFLDSFISKEKINLPKGYLSKTILGYVFSSYKTELKQVVYDEYLSKIEFQEIGHINTKYMYSNFVLNSCINYMRKNINSMLFSKQKESKINNLSKYPGKERDFYYALCNLLMIMYVTKNPEIFSIEKEMEIAVLAIKPNIAEKVDPKNLLNSNECNIKWKHNANVIYNDDQTYIDLSGLHTTK